MTLTALDKMNVQKYIREHAMGDIYYGNMRDVLGRRKDKVSDLEFLDYFTEYVVNELRKDEKVSVKHLSKVVSCVEAILGWVHNEKQPVTDETLDKIRSFREFYDEYLERTGIERDETLSNDYIDSVVEEVNKLYPVDSMDIESVSKYINKVAELEKQIKKLEKDLSEASRIYNSLDEEHAKKCDKLAELKGTIQSLEKDVREKGKEIVSLNETITALNSRIGELETSLNKETITNVELSSYKEQYGILSEEVGRLKTIIDNAKKEKEALEEQLRLEQEIKDLKASGASDDEINQKIDERNEDKSYKDFAQKSVGAQADSDRITLDCGGLCLVYPLFLLHFGQINSV